MATKHSELANIMKGLADQGVRYRENAKGGYVVYFPDGTTETFSASTDPRAIRSQRAVVRRKGLHWPLDPVAPERKEKPAAAKERPVAPKPEPTVNREPTAASTDLIPTVPSATVHRVNAKVAEVWLGYNTSNRHLSDRNVEKYASFMRNGQWHYDGSPIRFNNKGELIDGQHRLWAVIESDTEQEFLVLTGLDPHAFTTIDTGKARTFGDILSIAYPDLGQFTSIAAVTNLIYKWEQGYRGTMLLTNRSSSVAPEVLLEFFEENRDAIVEANREGRRIAPRIPSLTASTIALAYWVFSDIDEDDCLEFLSLLLSGAGLEDGSPILAVRNFFFRSAAKDKRNAPTDVQTAVLIKAWNAYRQGRKIQIMAYKPGGAAPEAFPIPV